MTSHLGAPVSLEAPDIIVVNPFTVVWGASRRHGQRILTIEYLSVDEDEETL